MEISPSQNFALFKAHKTFPRRKAQTDMRNLSHSLGLEQSRVHESDQYSYRSSQKIRSWIPEPSPPHAAPDHDLPLTPPINMLDHEDEAWIEERILAAGIMNSKQKGSDQERIITPIIQRHPLTPEITPPRVYVGNRSLAHPSTSRDRSLRTDSFETARETLSGDENPDTESLSMRPARPTWLRNAGNAKSNETGLGLGLEPEDEDPTPTEMTSKYTFGKNDFNEGDTLGGGEKNVPHGLGIKEGDHGLANSDLRRKSLRIRQRMPTHPLPRGFQIEHDTSSLVPRALSLRQRVEKCQQNISTSTEKFAEQIDWPIKDEEIDVDDKFREVDNRRFSQISATSTVVEAMVIDTPPQRRKTLRHTGKIRLSSSENPQAIHSNRSSMISTGSARRRLPRSSITPERDHRISDASGASGSLSSSLGRVREDTVPVMLIPKRGSSLKYSALGIGNVSRTLSLTSPREQSSRPTTAPETYIQYFDLPRHEPRRVSALITSSAPLNPEGRAVKEAPCAADLPVSMPSEQASTEIAKAVYTPSANTFSPQRQLGQPQPVLQLSEPPDLQGIAPDRSIAGEWSALRPRSALVTPFSLRSAHSSTPGTLEVNEATAISIYPHTNKSILVIQQVTGGDPNDPPGHSAIIAGNANIALPGPIAPVMIHQSRQALNSPLKNPRAPPHPPALKIIPPTPANAPPIEESGSQKTSTPPNKNRLNRPISMMKRALSSRRYSESFVSPMTRSLARRNTVSNTRPSVGDDQDGKLHPFWRPRGFWNDLSDSDSDSESDLGNVGSPADGHDPHENRISHSPDGRPLPRSSSLTRRFAASFSRKIGHNHSQHNNTLRHIRSLSEGSRDRTSPRTRYSFASLDNNRSYEFLPQPERKRGGVAMPLLGYRVQFVGLKGLAERIEKVKVRREEGRREKAREKLRESIGVVRLGEGGLLSGGLHDPRQ